MCDRVDDQNIVRLDLFGDRHQIGEGTRPDTERQFAELLLNAVRDIARAAFCIEEDQIFAIAEEFISTKRELDRGIGFAGFGKPEETCLEIGLVSAEWF